MKQILLSLLIAVSAQPVLALSCLPPDVAETFRFASESEDTYTVLLGRFEPIGTVPPRESYDEDGVTEELRARFQGQGLFATGFAPVQDRDVTMTLSCAGPWCASAPSDGEVLAFVRRTSTGYVLDVGPCYFNIFSSPSDRDIARVEACMRGEACMVDN